jgi:flagellar biosynthesis protein FliP
VPFVENLGVVQVFFLEKEIILSLKQVIAAFFTEPVTHHITQDAADRYKDPENNEVQETTARAVRKDCRHEFLTINTRHEKKAVTRKEKPHHQARFGKHNEEHNPETSVIDIKFRIKQVSERNRQKNFHNSALNTSPYRSQIKL